MPCASLAKKNKAELIAPLAALGARLSQAPSFRSPMPHAAAHGSLDAMRELLDLGVDPNVSAGRTHGQSGGPLVETFETAAMAAAFTGQASAIDLLVSHGADLEKKDHHGLTALHWASAAGQWSSVKCLLSHGANPRAANFKGITPLMASAERGHGPTTAQLAVHDPASADLRDESGYQAIHYAAESKRDGALRALILAIGPTIDLLATTTGGTSARTIAIKQGHEDALRIAFAQAERDEFARATATTATSALNEPKSSMRI